MMYNEILKGLWGGGAFELGTRGNVLYIPSYFFYSVSFLLSFLSLFVAGFLISKKKYYFVFCSK